MHLLSLALVALLSLNVPQAVSAQESDAHSVVGDLCARPEGWAPPYTNIYHLRNGGTIVFVAVTHVNDPNSPTIKQIKVALDRYKPDLVLVEGASSEKSVSDAYLRYLADTAEDNYKTGNIGENLYSVKLAADNRVSYMGWDLNPHQEYIADIAAGFDIADAIGAHLLRDRLNPLGPPSSPVVQRELDAVPHGSQPDSFDFAGWYRKIYGDVFYPSEGTPCGKGIASRIVKFESVRRTLNLANLLTTYAKPGSTVMVEAGAAHWVALQRYLTSISATTK